MCSVWWKEREDGKSEYSEGWVGGGWVGGWVGKRRIRMYVRTALVPASLVTSPLTKVLGV